MADPQDVNVVKFLGETGIDAMGAKFREGWETKRQVDSAMQQARDGLKPILDDIRKAFEDIGLKLKADIQSAVSGAGVSAGTGSTRSPTNTSIRGGIGSVPKVEKTRQPASEIVAAQTADKAVAGVGGGAMRGVMGGFKNFIKTPMVGSTLMGAGVSAINAGINAANARFERGREGVLSADRMSVLYQQMTGMGQLDVSSQYRMPLTNYRLGAGGINELMSLEAQTGISGIQQASSVEAFRTLSGYSRSTGEIAGMLNTMASAPVANRMFMMTGMGLIGPGGKQNTGMQVMQNLVRTAGLTSEEALKGAMAPGSITRARLANMGVPPEMITQVLQYAQSNLQYQKKGGKGMYDPSRKTDRRLMGIEENFATQVEETQRLETKRDETFYRRQVDNYATLERQTQSLTRVFGALEDRLSGILGLVGSNRIATSMFQGVTSGMGLGDPSGSGSGPKGYTNQLLLKGGDPDNVKSAKNNASFKSMHKTMQDRLIKMLSDNPKVFFGNGVRSSDEQRRMFMQRYRKTNSPTDAKGNKNVMWEGAYWEHVSGHAAAPPGRSMHEIGLAADLSGDLDWVVANASKYGLQHFANVNNEPHHVQPAELPRGRSAYEKQGAPWGHGPSGAAAFTGNSDFGETLDHSSPSSGSTSTVVSSANFSYGGSISERMSRRLDEPSFAGTDSGNSGTSRSRRAPGSIKTSTGTQVVQASIGNFQHGGSAKSGVEIGQWSADFLRAVGAPVTLANLEAMSAWIAAEGTAAKFNPLAVISKPTQSALGGPVEEGWNDFNSHGVKNFASYQQGLKMNAYHVLTYGKGVVNALKKGSNNPYDVITAIEKMVDAWAPDYAARSVLESRNVGTNITGPTGDPNIPMKATGGGSGGANMSVIGGHTFNISPNITMNGNGSQQDLQKIARDIAVMIRREIELQNLRSV